MALQAYWMAVRTTATQSLTCLLAPRWTAAVARKARAMVSACCCRLTASQADHQRRTGLLCLAGKAPPAVGPAPTASDTSLKHRAALLAHA